MANKRKLRLELQSAHDRIAILEQENAALRQQLSLLSDVQSKNIELQAKVDRLQFTVDQLLKHRFGSKSERYEDGDDPQMSLFPDLIKNPDEDEENPDPVKEPKSPSNDA